MATDTAWINVTMQRKMIDRGVFETHVAQNIAASDFEYFISWSGYEAEHVWPPGAPATPHTVIIVPGLSV